MTTEKVLVKLFSFIYANSQFDSCLTETETIQAIVDSLPIDEYQIAVDVIVQHKICDLSFTMCDNIERQDILLLSYLKHDRQNKIMMYWLYAKNYPSLFNVTVFLLNHPDIFQYFITETTQKKHLSCIQELRSHRNLRCDIVRSSLDFFLGNNSNYPYWDVNVCSIINQYICFENSQRDWFKNKTRTQNILPCLKKDDNNDRENFIQDFFNTF